MFDAQRGDEHGCSSAVATMTVIAVSSGNKLRVVGDQHPHRGDEENRARARRSVPRPRQKARRPCASRRGQDLGTSRQKPRAPGRRRPGTVRTRRSPGVWLPSHQQLEHDPRAVASRLEIEVNMI